MMAAMTGWPRRLPKIGAERLKRMGWALLFVLAAACGTPQPSEAGSADASARLLMLPIKLLDTSHEPADQSADHARRLAAMGKALSADITASGRYRAVSVSPETVRLACPTEAVDCLLGLAGPRGADVVFIGVVHKSSSLIMQMFARVVDVQTGREIFARDLNFRGDTDEAWRRAEAFLISQIKGGAALP